MNESLIQKYVAENRIDLLTALFQHQWTNLRRAEALNMLYLQEIKNLKFMEAQRELRSPVQVAEAVRRAPPEQSVQIRRRGPALSAKPQQAKPKPKPTVVRQTKSRELSIEL
jgi:hypothetical protein